MEKEKFGRIEEMKVLVTGGKGFIGSHLVNFLKEKGHWVRNVDIADFSYLKTKEDEFLRKDLRNRSNCFRVVKDIDWVFNLAADMGGIGYISDYNASVQQNNISINAGMLEAATYANVSRYFFSSSACTYPREIQEIPFAPPLKESDVLPAHPDSAYGWEKLYTELMCKSYEHDYGLPVRIARFHNIYGTHTTYKGGQEKAPAALCRKVAEAKDSIIIWGDGKQTRSFLYVDNCVEAFYLLTKSNYSDPLNIGTDRAISIDGLAKLIMRIAGKNLNIVHDLTKPQGVRGRNADLTLVKKVLDWKPKISLEEGMGRLYNWIKGEMEKDD